MTPEVREGEVGWRPRFTSGEARQREKLPLKAFWKSVEARLGAASPDELRAILHAMASRVHPSERRAFLAALSPATEARDEALEHALQDKLLTDITEQAQAFEELREGADEWEYEQGWMNEEDSLGPYEALVAPVAALFGRVQRTFERGRFPLARQAYRALFELLQQEDDYGRGLRPEHLTEQVELPEARARYLRVVYLTTPPAHRAEVMLEEMNQVHAWGLGQPWLEELLNLSPEPLPDFDAFLRDWEALLRQQENHSAEAWLREAIRIARGAEGLRELARSEPARHAQAWVDLLGLLESQGSPREVLDTAREALAALPPGLPLRASAADFLASAATRLGHPELVREARWEAFVACPGLSRLLELRDSASSEPERARLMKRAARQVEKTLARSPREGPLAWDEELPWEEEEEEELALSPRLGAVLVAHARLLGHDWETAWKLASAAKPLGWSSEDNPQTVVVPFLLLLLSGQVPGEEASRNVAELWRSGMENSLWREVWDGRGESKRALLERLSHAHAEVLPSLSVSRARQKQLLEWCLEVAHQRASAIVSRQFRKSYYKAAMLLAACAEVLQARGEPARAEELLTRFREGFPRHRAFQAKLDEALRRQ